MFCKKFLGLIEHYRYYVFLGFRYWRFCKCSKVILSTNLLRNWSRWKLKIFRNCRWMSRCNYKKKRRKAPKLACTWKLAPHFFFFTNFSHIFCNIFWCKNICENILRKSCSYLHGFSFDIAKKGLAPQIRGQESFYDNSLLKNNLLLILKARMFIVQLFIYTVPYISHLLM